MAQFLQLKWTLDNINLTRTFFQIGFLSQQIYLNHEEFQLNEDGNEEGGPKNKLVGITAGKSTNENNNSLIMGSFENFDLGNHEIRETVRSAD